MRRGPSFSSPELATISAIIFGGAALRSYRLTFQSLWFDELFSVVFSRSSLAVSEIIEKYAGDVHSIGYPVLLHFWLWIFGDNDLSARSLSAAWGVIGIAAIYLVARRIGGPRLALFAALLVSINAYHIAYSQEARSYALVFVFAALSYLALLVFVDAPDWRSAAVFGATVAITFHIHYYALVMFFGQVVAAALVLGLVLKKWHELKFLVVAGGVVALGMLPWIGPFLRVAGFDRYWPAVPDPWFFAGYLHIYFGENSVLSLAFAGLLIALPFLLKPREGEMKDGEVDLPGSWAAVLAISVGASLAVAYARSVLAVPMLIPRFTFVLLPAIFLLLALAITRIRPLMIRAGVAIAVVVVSLANLAFSEYYTLPRKEQWREAAWWVLDHPRFDPASDPILALYAPGFRYYADQHTPQSDVREATLENLRQSLADGRTPPAIWVLLARGTDPPLGFRALLEERFHLTARAEFLSTGAELWEPRSTE